MATRLITEVPMVQVPEFAKLGVSLPAPPAVFDSIEKALAPE